jgi:hypothetical protein
MYCVLFNKLSFMLINEFERILASSDHIVFSISAVVLFLYNHVEES